LTAEINILSFKKWSIF